MRLLLQPFLKDIGSQIAHGAALLVAAPNNGLKGGMRNGDRDPLRRPGEDRFRITGGHLEKSGFVLSRHEHKKAAQRRLGKNPCATF